jgi:hypothetical protein
MMNGKQRNRWFLLSGVLFVALMLVAVVLVGQYEHLPPVADVAAHFNANVQRIALGGYIGAVAAFFLLWFAGSLRAVLRAVIPTNSPLADIAFGGAAGGAILLAIAFAGLQGMAMRAGTPGGIGADAVAAMNDSWSQMIGLAMPVSMAACCAATGLAITRGRLLPAWFGWLSVLLAVGLLSPISYAMLGLAIIWTAGLSLWLFARAGREGVIAGEAAGSEALQGTA